MIILLAAGCMGAQMNTTSKQPETTRITAPPVAERREHVHGEHGVEREDPYYWMRDKEDSDVISHLEAENRYTEEVTAHLAPLRKQLFDEILGRIQEDDLSVPVNKGGWWYYRRTEEGKPYSIHCRKKGSMEAEEEIILDQNVLAEGSEYFSLGSFAVSSDHTLLAYSTDVTGAERYLLKFKNLETGELLEDEIPNIAGGVTWGEDGENIFYTRMDDAMRPYRIHRHRLGSPAAEDALVYEESDEKYRVGVWKSRSKKFVFLYSGSSMTTEVRVLDAAVPEAEPRVLSPRHQGMEYWPEHQGDRFLVVTNDCDDGEGAHSDCARNFKLMSAALDSTDRSQWTELIPHREDVQITNVDAFGEHVVVFEREGGLEYMRVQDLRTGEDYRIPMPEPVFSIWGSNNPENSSRVFRYGYTSLTAPVSYYDFDLETKESVLLKETPVIGYDRSLFKSERFMAEAPDGVQVPVSLVYRKDLDLSSPRPLYLYGYGSYGHSLDPYFSVSRLSLLERGAVFAMAHVRGGGEMGRHWYEDGKFLKKKNTFSDFIACAEMLVGKGYTAPDRLVVSGGSAGGLLIGASVNMRPELFHAAVADVPFVDVVTTMLDDSIPLTAGEWEEWGNPKDREYFDYMLSYSPYDNVSAQDYPHMLVTSGLNDPRVQYWEPTKWVARLRERKTGDNVLLLRTNMSAGHGGQSGRYGRIEDTAFEYAWLLDTWGLAETTATTAE